MRAWGRLVGWAAVVGATVMAMQLSRSGPAALGQTASPTPSTLPTAGPTPSAGPGRDLYLRDCAWCHGPQGQGTVYGPTLVGVGAASADFMLSTGRMPISQPERQPPRAPVPYSQQEIDALVGFVAGLGPGPSIPSVTLSGTDLGQGSELYQENCAACHGATGAGGAMTNGFQAPSLHESTPVQVAEAVRLGGAGLRSGNMPKFGPDVLSDEQVADVARYVQYLRSPEDRGGDALGHFGPIPEGAVAWVVGLLGLVLLTRWIGTSR